MQKSFPDFGFNEKELTEDGWFLQDHRENNEEFFERAVKTAKFIENLAFERCFFIKIK